MAHEAEPGTIAIVRPKRASAVIYIPSSLTDRRAATAPTKQTALTTVHRRASQKAITSAHLFMIGSLSLWPACRHRRCDLHSTTTPQTLSSRNLYYSDEDRGLEKEKHDAAVHRAIHRESEKIIKI